MRPVPAPLPPYSSPRSGWEPWRSPPDGPTNRDVATALSLDVMADQTGTSGGSPPLLVIVSDSDTNGYAPPGPPTLGRTWRR